MNTLLLLLSLQIQPPTLQIPDPTQTTIEAPCRINRHKRTCTICWHK